MSDWRLHPSVDFIIKPHKERGKAIFFMTDGWWVMKRWADGGQADSFVRTEDAIDLVDMLNKSSEAAVRAVWRRP